MSEVASYLVTSACVCVCMCVERKDCPKQRQDGSVGRSVKSVYLWDVVCVRARECERERGGGRESDGRRQCSAVYVAKEEKRKEGRCVQGRGGMMRCPMEYKNAKVVGFGSFCPGADKNRRGRREHGKRKEAGLVVHRLDGSG